MRIRSLVWASGVVVAFTSSAAGQSVRVADSLLRAGALSRADSVYYAASGNRPGDPAARRALGDFLIARGATRVGSTLLEEAIRFGGDRPAIERDLGAVYLLMGDYHLLAALTTTPSADRDRAKWLIAHETRTIAPDSMISVALRSPTDSVSLGRVFVKINGRVLEAALTPRVHGIVVSGSAAPLLHLHVFPAPGGESRPSGLLAAADSIAIGGLSMRNVPVVVASVDVKESVAIGLDMLGKFSPTFEAKLSRLFLRVGVNASTTSTDTLPTLMLPSDFQVLETDGWVSISSAVGSQQLRDRVWTLDARRGRIVIEP